MDFLDGADEWAARWPNLTGLGEALGTIFTALIAVVAAIYAARQVRLARLDREDRNRPFVTITLRPSHGIVANIVIRNEGTTVARNVRFVFTPEWESSDPVRTKIRDSKVWRDGIPNLVPGQEVAMFADMFPDRHATNLPRAYEVEVSCDGRKRRWKRTPARFSERFVLDFEIFYGYSTATLWGLHDVGEALRRISAKIDRWGEVGGEALSVVTRNGDRRDQRERMETEAYMAARRAQEEQVAPPGLEDDVLSLHDAGADFSSQLPITRPPAARHTSTPSAPAAAGDEAGSAPATES